MGLNIEKKQLSNSVFINIVDIEEIDVELKKLLDRSLVKICEGESGNDLKLVKKRVKNFLDKNDNFKMGGIAEFLVHLILKEDGYKQECLYANLEENSFKKGFDGYYSKENEEWIMESKSGSIKTKNMCHRNKLKESYDDLKNKLKGNSKNNPWLNAYHHANLIDVNCEATIRNHIKELSNQFDSDIFHNIQNFNIIPTSTVFLDGNWNKKSVGKIKENLDKIHQKIDYNKLVFICITKKSVNLFMNYLNIE